MEKETGEKGRIEKKAMASKSLDDLDSRFRPLVDQLLSNLSDAGVKVVVIDTLRTPVEQAQNIANGVSWTQNSKHLPQPPDGKSLAIDLCPTEYLTMKNWNPTGPLWWQIAQAGVALGMRSGMDWHDIGLPPVGETRSSFDPGHLEIVL